MLTLDTIAERHGDCPPKPCRRASRGQFVYVVKPDNTVEIRPVATGGASGGRMVIEKGIAPGETVVTDGQLRLFPGATIQAGGSSQDRNGAAMNLSRIFIERPIMTALVAFAILLFGVRGFRALPVAALPSVDYPTIQVGAACPAPIRRPWPPPWPRRSNASSPPSPASSR